MAAVVWPNGSTSIPPVSGEYGMRWHPIQNIWKMHDGIDLVGWSTIVSPVSGLVIFASYSGGYGNLVKVRAANGDEHWMAHNARFLVNKGAWVSQGQALAIMGTTGASTGIHSHYEIHPKGGRAVSPRDYIASANAASAGGGGTPIDYALLRRRKEDDMFVRGTSVANVVYATYSDVKGRPRIRTCGKFETAFAVAGGLVITGDDASLTGLGKELLNGIADTSVVEAVWSDAKVQRQIEGKVVGISTIQELADAKTNTEKLLARAAVELTNDQLLALAASISKALGDDLVSEEEFSKLLRTELGKLQIKLAA